MARIENLFKLMGEERGDDYEYGEPTLEEIVRFLAARGVPDPMKARLEYGECGSHDLWVKYDGPPQPEQPSAYEAAQATAPLIMEALRAQEPPPS